MNRGIRYNPHVPSVSFVSAMFVFSTCITLAHNLSSLRFPVFVNWKIYSWKSLRYLSLIIGLKYPMDILQFLRSADVFTPLRKGYYRIGNTLQVILCEK